MSVYVIPTQYSGMTLEEFLEAHLSAYPEVEEALKKLSDSTSPEYQTFFVLATARHLHSMMVRQRGKSYQFYRLSSIRKTAGYERFTYHLWDARPHEEDDANVAYRFFWDRWDEWVTIPLKL